MRINKKEHDSIVIFELNGDFTKNESNHLKILLEELLDHNKTYIILDLENVKFMDSQAILTLLRMNREFLAAGGGIKLLRPQKIVQQFMHIGQVLDLFEKYETKIEALRSFNKNIKRKENFEKGFNPLEEASKNQRIVLLKLVEILINKGYLTFDEIDQEITKSTQLVMSLFRKELKL